MEKFGWREILGLLYIEHIFKKYILELEKYIQKSIYFFVSLENYVGLLVWACQDPKFRSSSHSDLWNSFVSWMHKYVQLVPDTTIELGLRSVFTCGATINFSLVYFLNYN